MVADIVKTCILSISPVVCYVIGRFMTWVRGKITLKGSYKFITSIASLVVRSSLMPLSRAIVIGNPAYIISQNHEQLLLTVRASSL